MNTLEEKIAHLKLNYEHCSHLEFQQFADEFIDLLNKGKIRAAEKINEEWVINTWVKEGILILFRYGKLIEISVSDEFRFFDKHTLPLKQISLQDNIRLVPGGSSIRTGAYIANGVICMPPMYINIGAYIDSGSMVDSHALVGTCAQIGKNVHISAAAQIGGVLEPIGARPVIIEDNVLIGGNCGIYEGVLVRQNAIIASGVILTASTPIYDIVHNRIIKGTNDKPLEVPRSAVVVAGSRKVKGYFAENYGLGIYTPVIVKYRDEQTDARVALEEILR
ncbi:MAG: 2,3,4,5-tetrahydropyridine-2,6-dicarboxylate N-succinyltransferase [Bacteroidota bacterium]